MKTRVQRELEGKIQGLKDQLSSTTGGEHRGTRQVKERKPKSNTTLQGRLDRTVDWGKNQIKLFNAKYPEHSEQNNAQSKEEPLEELTDGELTEVEKLKSWELWLENKGGLKQKLRKLVTPPDIYPSEIKGIEGSERREKAWELWLENKGEGGTSHEVSTVVGEEADITQQTIKNPKKYRKSHFRNVRDEKPAIQGTKVRKEPQHGRSTSNYLSEESIRQSNIPEGIELDYIHNPTREHKGLGSTRKVPKTQKELDADWDKQNDKEFQEKKNIENQKKLARVKDGLRAREKAWESWLEKKRVKHGRRIYPDEGRHGEGGQQAIDNPENFGEKKVGLYGQKVKSWEKWLEIIKDQGQGDARYGNPHETGFEDPRVLQTSVDDFSLEDKEGNEKEDNDKPYIERTQGKDRDGRHQ